MFLCKRFAGYDAADQITLGPAVWGLYGDESLPGNFGQDLRFLDLTGTLHRFTIARRIHTFALSRVMSDSVVRVLSEISHLSVYAHTLELFCGFCASALYGL